MQAGFKIREEVQGSLSIFEGDSSVADREAVLSGMQAGPSGKQAAVNKVQASSSGMQTHSSSILAGMQTRSSAKEKITAPQKGEQKEKQGKARIIATVDDGAGPSGLQSQQGSRMRSYLDPGAGPSSVLSFQNNGLKRQQPFLGTEELSTSKAGRYIQQKEAASGTRTKSRPEGSDSALAEWAKFIERRSQEQELSYLHDIIPDEIILIIFGNLKEFDLVQVSETCRRFYSLANDNKLWRDLYDEVFEYDLPMFLRGTNHYHTVPVESCETANAWKESFVQLYDSLHVRPGFKKLMEVPGRNVRCFDTVREALCYNKQKLKNRRIFVHTGTYTEETINISSLVTMLGAAKSPIAENVVLENSEGTVVRFSHGASRSYFGHMTVQYINAITPQTPKHYAIEIGKNTCPTVEYATVRSSSKANAAIYVTGLFTEPHIRYCRIVDSQYISICVTNCARGTYECNEMVGSTFNGIQVTYGGVPEVVANRIEAEGRLYTSVIMCPLPAPETFSWELAMQNVFHENMMILENPNMINQGNENIPNEQNQNIPNQENANMPNQ